MRITAKIGIFIALVAFSINLFGQNERNPFEIQIIGKGTHSIIFIPGFACSGDVWDSTISLFEKDFTCYKLTMAGFAGVPAQPKSSFSIWEKGIADFILANKINKPIIIGHSMGGGLAMALAADYPDLISKIIVVDALPCLPALMNTAYKVKDNNDCGAIISQFTAIKDDQFYQMQKLGMKRLLADSTKIELVVGWSVKSDRATFAGIYCDFTNTDLREKIANIKCPTLILLEPSFKNLKEAIAEQYKNCKSAVFQYANKGLHFIMYDDKLWFDRQLYDFIIPH